jgi:hypothetical protein
MSDEERTVATQETETAEALPVATTEAPPETTPEGAAGPEAEEATQEADKLPTTEEAPPSWATIDGKPYGDAYEALEHEGFRPVLERRDKDTHEAGRREGHSQAEQGFNKEQAAEVVQEIAGRLGTVVERLEEGNVEGSVRVIDKLGELIRPYGKTFIQGLMGDAQKSGGQGTAALVLDGMKASLPLKLQHELEDFAQSGHKDWRPILGKWLDLQRPGIEAEIEQMKASRKSKEAHAEEKSKTPPPVKPEGSGGGKGVAHKDMAPEEEAKLTPVQRDAMTRDFAKNNP